MTFAEFVEKLNAAIIAARADRSTWNNSSAELRADLENQKRGTADFGGDNQVQRMRAILWDCGAESHTDVFFYETSPNRLNFNHLVSTR